MEPEFIDIKSLSLYLSIKRSTLYARVEARKIPHYRVGKLLRFKKCEIDSWMQFNKTESPEPGKATASFPGPTKKPVTDIDRVVKKAIDSARAERYNSPHGKPDRIKGLGKEVPDGTV